MDMARREGDSEVGAGGFLSIWTIYDHPLDYPDMFVARRFDGETPTSDMFTATTLDELRLLLPPGLDRLPRYPQDDPKIVEVWL